MINNKSFNEIAAIAIQNNISLSTYVDSDSRVCFKKLLDDIFYEYEIIEENKYKELVG